MLNYRAIYLAETESLRLYLPNNKDALTYPFNPKLLNFSKQSLNQYPDLQRKIILLPIYLMAENKFKEIVRNLPRKPGVYRFYSKDGSVLYIGKAKDLKNRVSSYFQEGRPRNERLTLMISQIEKVEYSVVNSEEESLILEANLIHNLQPKYNIKLKDDKNYLYVRITNDPIPAVFLVRKKYDPKSHYFGPYTKRTGIFETLRTLRTIFPYCQEKSLQKRPCSYYSIKQCDGICFGLESREDYLQKIDQISKILAGKTEEVEAYLEGKIKESVTLENYPLAGLWRDRLKTLKETISDQKIILPQPQDIDLITLMLQNTPEGLQLGSIFIQNIRDGRIVNVNNFLLSGTEDKEESYDLEENQRSISNTTPNIVAPKLSEQVNQNLEMYDEQGNSPSVDFNPDSNNLAFAMLERFLSNYKSFQNDRTPAIIQVFELPQD